MIQLKRAPEHHVDRVFILILLTMFAIISFLVISIGAKQYQTIADHMSENYEVRTVNAYLMEKLNQSDISGSVEIITLENNNDAICLSQTVNETLFNTYIYTYKDYLYEITVTADSDFDFSAGQKVIETAGLSASVLPGNLLAITTTDTSGKEHPLYISLNAK